MLINLAGQAFVLRSDPHFMRGGPTDGVIVSGARVRGSVRLRLACIAVMLVPGRIVDNYSYGYTVGLFI